MRKTIALSFAIALVLGMAQCKKVETIDPDGGEKIQITLDVDGGKHVINPGTSGQVAYESGDVIYVGDGSRFIGTLTHNGTKFVGEVNTPVGDKLHFYFIGGFEPSATPVQGSTTSFTVNISNQASKLPVLSYVDVDYVPGQTAYTCILRNKCVLVEFKLTTGTSDAVTLNSVPTIATVNFSTPGITSTETTGNITLNSESTTSKWAILLPMATATNTNVTIGSNNYDVVVPVITANGYLHDETAIKIDNAADYVFSVSSTQKVHFSPGNLQYLGTGTSGTKTPKWRFADNQWDYMGDGPTSRTAYQGNVAIDGYSTYNTGSGEATPTNADKAAARDLFGWRTSGYSNMYPYMTNKNEAAYGNGSSNNISGTDYDWGVYNDIYNPKTNTTDPAGTWRTLTSAEWAYLFNTRSNTTVNRTSDARFTKAAITTPSSTTVKGVIIFPDSYSGGTPSGVTWGTINGTSNGYTTTCTAAGWATLEAAGCVFLPVTCRRLESTMYEADYGYYWSSTANGGYSAYAVYFRNTDLLPDKSYGRARGYSVRLVR